ncbi:MAG: hypothetical protein ABFR53_01695 [Actinomycetota bacterium]
MGLRLLIGMIVFSTAAASCSSESRVGFYGDMSSDEVACSIAYGDADPYIVGPLGPSASEEVHPNDYTTFRIGRTASDVIIVVEQPGSGSNAGIPLNNLPADGIVARGPFRDGGNPGYEVTCWRGDN